MESNISNNLENFTGNLGYLTERGIKVRVKAPFILRVFGNKVITLDFKRASSGMFGRAYREFKKCKIGIDALLASEDTEDVFSGECPIQVYRALGALLVSSQTKYFFIRRPLAAWLSSKIAPKDAMKLLQIYFLESGALEFIGTIRYFREKKILIQQIHGQS